MYSILAAPSVITDVQKVVASDDAIQLSWNEPKHPNGIILDYEVKYYEKVGEASLHKFNYKLYSF